MIGCQSLAANAKTLTPHLQLLTRAPPCREGGVAAAGAWLFQWLLPSSQSSPSWPPAAGDQRLVTSGWSSAAGHQRQILAARIPIIATSAILAHSPNSRHSLKTAPEILGLRRMGWEGLGPQPLGGGAGARFEPLESSRLDSSG